MAIIQNIQHLIHQKKVRQGLFLFYLTMIILVSILPINNQDSSLNNTFIVYIRLDYLFHAVCFIPFAWLSIQSGMFNFRKSTGLFLLLLCGFFLILFSEGIQYFLPWRAFNINDLLANFLGLAIGFLILFVKKIRFSE